MEAKIGRERLDALEATATSRKWSRDELEALKIYYAIKIKAIERGEDPRPISGLEMSSVFENLSPSDDLLQHANP